MALTRPAYAVDNVQQLADLVQEQATLVKQTIDKTGADTKEFLSNTHIPEVESLDAQNVKLTGDQTVAGVKTFSSSPIIPAPTTDMQASTKKYADDKDSAQTAALTNHKTSADHDGRYYTADEINSLEAQNVKLTWNQSIGGIKTFTSSPVVPTPTADMQAATKKYVDDNSPVLQGSIHDQFLGNDPTDVKQRFSAHLADYATHKLDWVNAVSAGADNTGVNDCSALIQSLLNDYSTIYFPRGTYKFLSSIILPSNKTIFGEETRREYDDGAIGGVILSFANTTGYGITSEDAARNITVKNVTLVGNYAGGGGIRLYCTTATDVFNRLEHIKVHGFSGDGIFIDNLSECLLFDVQSMHNYGNGLVSSSYGAKITNCQTFANNKNGMKITRGGCLVTSCKSFGNGIDGIDYAGINLAEYAKTVHLIGCSSQENEYHGLIIDGVGVENNIVEGISLLGNNKSLTNGCGLVIGGFNNRVSGNAIANIRHSDGNYASDYAIVKLSPGAKFNRIELNKGENFDPANIMLQFKGHGTINEHIVLNDGKNPFNSVIINGSEYITNADIIDSDFNGILDNAAYAANGTPTSAISGDKKILTVTLGANDTLPVPLGYSTESSVGNTGVKYFHTITTALSGRIVYVEFELKANNYNAELGLTFRGFLKGNAGTITKWFDTYDKYGVYVSTGWTKVKFPVDFGTVVTPSEVCLLFMFMANVQGDGATRLGTSFDIRNLKLSI